jgi:hypothetical protein
MTTESRPIMDDFEGSALPADWRTAGGALQLSTRHFKDGRQSLQ